MRMDYSPDQLHDAHSFLFTSYVPVPLLLLRLLIIGSVSTKWKVAWIVINQSYFFIYRSYLNLRS